MRREAQLPALVIAEPLVRFPNDFVKLPLFDLSVAAGDGALLDRPETVAATLSFRRDWLSQEGLHPLSLALFRVSGESMEPTLRDRDVIMVDRTAREIQGERIFVLRIDSEAYIKRLRLLAGEVEISSDNPAYRTWSRPLAEVVVIGRVVWLGRRLP